MIMKGKSVPSQVSYTMRVYSHRVFLEALETLGVEADQPSDCDIYKIGKVDFTLSVVPAHIVYVVFSI